MKKIALNKETLRKLEDGTLKNVVGGDAKYTHTRTPGCYETVFPIKPC